MASGPRDPYRILGVPRGASQEELARAYREKARRLHPDGGSADADAGRFGELAEAYAAATDAARRGDPDRPAARPGGSGVRVPVRRVVRPRRGPDLRASAAVPLVTALLGGEVDVELPDGGPRRVRLPPGVEDGDVVRVPGLGRTGSDGGGPGDLLVAVTVEPDPRFGRHGADVTTTVAVRWPDAVLGAQVPVQAPTGPLRLALPAGTASGTVLRVAGHGVPERGDLLVTVVVDVPSDLTAQERALVVQLAQALRPPGA